MLKPLQSFSLSDLEIISVLPRYQSLRSLSRDLRTTPSNISTKLSFLEGELSQTLLKRSARGYTLTREGARLAKLAGEILTKCEEMITASERRGEVAQAWITIGTRGFLNSLLAPLLIQAMNQHQQSIGCRFIDFSPQELVVAAFRSSLDVAITLEECFLGERWQSKRIGETQSVLLVRKDHPLERTKAIDDLAQYRVIRSAYWDGNSVVSSGDLLPHLKKMWGAETQTAATALPVILESDCVAFLPRLAAATLLKNKQVVEIFSNQITGKTMPIFLHVNKDTIHQKLYKLISSVVENTVAEFG